MKTKELLKKIEEIFTAELKTKTGWGRNEILSAYQKSVNEALAEAIDNVTKKE